MSFLYDEIGGGSNVAITGGTIDNTTIGGTTPAAGSFTTLSASTSISGTLSTTAQPNITSVGTLASLVATTVDINGGSIDGTVIGGTTTAAGSFTSLNAHSGTFTAQSGSSIIADRTGNPGSVEFKSDGTQTGQVQARTGGGLDIYTGSVPVLRSYFTTAGLTVNGNIVTNGGAGSFSSNANGAVLSQQNLDVTGAGGRFEGISSRGTMGQIDVGQVATGSDAGKVQIALPDNTGTFFSAMRLTTAALDPFRDNVSNLGTAAARWSEVFAGTGTINTSDAREKTAVRNFTAAEIAAAKDISKEIGAYKFLSSVESKGEAAREHIGMTVQRAIEIMQSNGLNPFGYGFICYDQWEAEYETNVISDAVYDEEGKEVTPAVTEQVLVRDAGNRYGFRMDELAMFVIRGLEARLTAAGI